MKLYLVRHGEAVSDAVDPTRPLSEEGRVEVEKVAQQLKAVHINPKMIYHSGKKRAQQTAQIIGQAINAEIELNQRENLAPNDSLDSICQELNEHSDDLMIVGHMPFLGKLIASLIRGTQTYDMKAAEVVTLHRDDEHQWEIHR